jgi:hypothetical protein
LRAAKGLFFELFEGFNGFHGSSAVPNDAFKRMVAWTGGKHN